MHPKFSSSTLHSAHHFERLFNVEMPPPALERGWLHSRELKEAWNVAALVKQIGEGCWFSHYYRSDSEDGDERELAPYAIAGFWPSGGFVEIQMRGANPLEDRPQGTLTVYAETPRRAEELMAELLANYCHSSATKVTTPRIGMLNYSYGDLSVEKIPVTSDQTISRDRVDLYYGDGMDRWVGQWIEILQTRHYGLTVLTGEPGTGKTSLIRSLAHWLASSHVFYFMPASRFTSVDSGEIVTFWAGENRTSKHRKVLVLEDAESIMLRRGDENREKVATLLNLTDGMLGDALGLHVVCTLNSQLQDLDPALLRPGRLVAQRDFGPLNTQQARRLAAELGLPEPAADRLVLAEILNPEKRNNHSSHSRRVMGFNVPQLQQT